MKDHRFVLTSSSRPERLSTSTHLPHEQPDQEPSLKSPPPSHTHTTITAALAPDPSFSGYIQGRDLVTWEWSHSEFRNTFPNLLQRRILWLKSDSKENQLYIVLLAPHLMPVPTKPHSEARPTDPPMITVNTLEGMRRSPASRGTATEQSAEPTPSLTFLLQICKFKGWHKAVIKTDNWHCIQNFCRGNPTWAKSVTEQEPCQSKQLNVKWQSWKGN